MIQAIIFDMNGVLVTNFDPSIFGKHAHKLNIPVGEFLTILQEFFEWDLTKKEMTLKDFWKNKKGDWKHITLTDIQSLIGDLHASEKVKEDVLDVARHLKTKYKIGVLSNIGVSHKSFGELLEKKYKMHDLINYPFSTGHIGIAKPDPRVFEHILNEMKLNPSEVVFIDDKEDNVQSASRLGIKAIQFVGAEELILELRSVGVDI